MQRQYKYASVNWDEVNHLIYGEMFLFDKPERNYKIHAYVKGHEGPILLDNFITKSQCENYLREFTEYKNSANRNSKTVVTYDDFFN